MGGFSADFNTSVNTGEAKSITDRTSSWLDDQYSTTKANTGTSVWKRRKNWMQGYLDPRLDDPRAQYEHYNRPLSRFGEWWNAYDDAYGRIWDATQQYQGDWNNTFDTNRDYLKTTGIQDSWNDYLNQGNASWDGYLKQGQGLWNAYKNEASQTWNDYGDAGTDMWGDYLDRIKGYYGSAYDNVNDNWIDKDAYDLWGDLATGDPQGVQDWFAQSQMGKYLSDQANENFYRQAQLGGWTYNPQDVQEYISSRIVAPEAQQAFGNLSDYARLQHATSVDLEKWYAEAVAQGDTIAQQQIAQLMSQQQTALADIMREAQMGGMNLLSEAQAGKINMATLTQQQIAELMNQQNQQLWQSGMAQGMGDANLRYLLEGQLPATREMDYINQYLAHLDAQRTMKMLHYDKNQYANYLANVGMPNAYDSFLWESGMYQQALQNQQEALNSAMSTELAGAGIGALGSIFSGAI